MLEFGPRERARVLGLGQTSGCWCWGYGGCEGKQCSEDLPDRAERRMVAGQNSVWCSSSAWRLQSHVTVGLFTGHLLGRLFLPCGHHFMRLAPSCRTSNVGSSKRRRIHGTPSFFAAQKQMQLRQPAGHPPTDHGNRRPSTTPVHDSCGAAGCQGPVPHRAFIGSRP